MSTEHPQPPTEAPPASLLVQVVALYRPELMIEIAAEAVLPDSMELNR